MGYQVAIAIFVLVSVIWGFRKGFARQVPSLIGLAFGIISARLLAPGLYSTILELTPSLENHPCRIYYLSCWARGFVFITIYCIFTLITGFLGSVFGKGEHTMLNNIGGAIFSVFESLLFVGIIFNCIASRHPDSELVKSGRSDDGSATELVMLLSPALLGGPDIEDYALQLQYNEAKTIS